MGPVLCRAFVYIPSFGGDPEWGYCVSWNDLSYKNMFHQYCISYMTQYTPTLILSPNVKVEILLKWFPLRRFYHWKDYGDFIKHFKEDDAQEAFIIFFWLKDKK